MIRAASRSVVTTTTRTAMSNLVSEDIGCWVLGAGCCVRGAGCWSADLLTQPPAPCTQHHVPSTVLTDLSDEREHRHVHRDDDAADGDAEERDEQRLEQFHEARDRDVDFVFVE